MTDTCDTLDGQIMFFEKSKTDLENQNVQITVTDLTATNDGADYVNLMRNRKNTSAWMTTGSNDAANTELIFDITDERYLNDFFIIGHNLAAFDLQYWTGIVWQDFATPINVTGATEYVHFFTGLNVNTSKLRLRIYGTQIADCDKAIRQVIWTERIGGGQLESWPEIKSPIHSTNKKINRMLSGKVHVTESLGAFKCSLKVKFLSIENDLDMVESIYFKRDGVLMWLAGNKETQFFYNARGYRAEDVYLVRPTNDYKPEFWKGWYGGGLKINMKLEETNS